MIECQKQLSNWIALIYNAILMLSRDKPREYTKYYLFDLQQLESLVNEALMSKYESPIQGMMCVLVRNTSCMVAGRSIGFLYVKEEALSELTYWESSVLGAPAV